ncbi:MAG: IS30 family transposase [Hymenobacter sp.]|nr:MAG: IS30 family transposase [Hymenobacter sp.]
MLTYQRLTLPQRYLIQTLHRHKKTQQFIAQQIGVSQSTVSRELATFKRQLPQSYDAQHAHQRAATAKKRTPYKLKGHLLNIVLTRLRDRLSPEQICGEMQRIAQQKRLHHETIYRYIYRHEKLSDRQGTDHERLAQYLRIRHRKKYKKRGKPGKRQLIPNRVSIEHRPAIVETNTEVGHWEADTVIGKGHDGALLTLVERRTKYVLIVKLASKQAGTLAAAATKAFRRSELPVKTITFDNGLEFARHESIGRQLGAATYFAHPYHSWERGLNENTNGLIRQYIPKDCPISVVRSVDVSWLEDQLNHRPRKSLGYLSPAEFAKNELYALQR